MARSIYICYFGVREPLVQTQVIPYLCELMKDGHLLSLLTFEQPSTVAELQSSGIAKLKKELLQIGIDWHWLRYHKRPSAIATAWDVLQGAWFIHRFISLEKPDILHGRVHTPTLMGAVARKLSRHKPKLLFDIRGFFPEEYTDAGIWPEGGWLYRIAKRIETWLLKESDGFVVLTEKARELLFPESSVSGLDAVGRPVEVIPCCVDMARFNVANENSRQAVREMLGIEDRKTIAYVGALGGWYLTSQTADFFGAIKANEPNAFALMLTQSRADMIEPQLREHGYSNDDFLIKRVSSGEVPRYLSAADAAVSFIKRCYSKQASSPTKNAEYLACGLPIIANDGVGDMTAQIIEDRTGVIIETFDDASYAEALEKINAMLSDREELAMRCRASAEKRFDLEKVGGPRYRRLYVNLLADTRP